MLLVDDFTAIAGTVELGRRIYENIRNAMRFLMAVHVPLAGMALLPLAAGWPLFAFPVHVVFLEFVIDPACSLVFEAERGDRDLMRRPPRPPSERLFGSADVLLAAGLGAAILVVVLALYGSALSRGLGEDHARTLAFAALVGGDLGLILATRSRLLTSLELLARPNAAWWTILAATLAALLAVTYLPAAARIFRFAPVAPAELLLALAAGAASVLWYDLEKLRRRRRDPAPI